MHRLVTSALGLRRKIYASLPFGYRIAQVFIRLAGFVTDAIGRGFLQKFREYDQVTGIEPGDDGKAFGKKLYAEALRVVKNPSRAEDVIQGLFQEYLEKGTFKTIKGPMHNAERFVLNMVKLRAMNALRPDKKLRDLTIQNDEGEEVERVIEDPSEWERFDDGLLEQIDLHRIRAELKHMNPNLEAYFVLMLDGVSDKEILEGQMLPMLEGKDIKGPNWNQTYKPKLVDKIQKVLQKYVEH